MSTYDTIQSASARAIKDIGRIQVWIAHLAAWFLNKADKDRLQYEVAVAEQNSELNELKLLGVTLQIKDHALANGGFAIEHGPALEAAADHLFHGFDWEDEDIAFWFAGLVLNDDGSSDVEIFIDEDE